MALKKTLLDEQDPFALSTDQAAGALGPTGAGATNPAADPLGGFSYQAPASRSTQNKSQFEGDPNAADPLLGGGMAPTMPAPGATGAGPRPPAPAPPPPPTVPTPPPAGSTLPAWPGNPADAIRLFHNLPATSASIDKILEYLNANGVKATRATHAGGTLPSEDKILIDGRAWDLIVNSGPNGTWNLNPGPEEMGGAAPGGAGLGGLLGSLGSAPSGGAAAGGSAPFGSSYAPTVPASSELFKGKPYVPGEITDAGIPDFSYDSLLKDAGSYQPGDLSGLGPTSLDTATEGAAQRLLDQPAGYDQRTIDEMKAKSKDELAQQQAADDANLVGFSYGTGIQDSNWIASERNASKRSRDRGIVEANRNVDLTAAEKRAADQRANLEAASGVSNSAYSRRLSTAQLGESTKQAAASSRQTAVNTAISAALQRGQQLGDRQALRETVNAKASELGISADQLQVQYTLGLIDDATRRYGISADAAARMASIASSDRQHAESIAYQIAALSQQDAQFGAGYGLDLTRLQSDIDQRAFDNYYKSTTGAGA